MAPVAALMKFELERGNIDGFAELLNQHWELSKQLDKAVQIPALTKSLCPVRI